MDNMIHEIKQQIAECMQKALERAVAEGVFPAEVKLPEITVQKPREKAHGDFALNLAMQMAKAAKKPPRTIAEELISRIDTNGTYIDHMEVAGAGFMNVFLKSQWLYDALDAMNSKGADYGKSACAQKQKIMVEFVSANPTGPMHMGNARGGALGDSLAEVLKWAGNDVTREFYLNNAGAQIEKLGKSLNARYIQILKGDDAIEFPEDGYHGKDIRTHMEAFIDEFGTGHLDMPEEERKKIFIEYVLKRNIQTIKTDLGKYRIHYDVWFPETDLYESGEVEDTIAALKESGYAYEEGGAVWFKSSQFGSEKDDVLIRQNGIPTYFAVDIAYHRNKFIVRGFDKVINIWGADHHGHIARMKGAMQALGIAPERLQVITIQLVRLMNGNEVVRMSKRTGEMVTLGELIEDIGIDAARFFFNLRQADSHFDFDLELALTQTNENPVYYVQYAHARICSILRLLQEEDNVTLPAYDQIDMTLLQEPAEKELIEKLAYFPEEIVTAAETTDSTRMTHYAMDLAALFHSFYNACRVRCDERPLMFARLKLIDLTRGVIASALKILGVSAPEKM